MNTKPLISSFIAVCCAVLLAACASPPKVIFPFQPGTPSIRSVAIILDKPAFILDSGGFKALESEGWSSGKLERKFCYGLAERLRAAHVEAHCALSFWGGMIDFENVQSHQVSHVITIKPINLRYQVYSRGGVASPGSNPSMETMTVITDSQTNKMVWSGIVDIIYAPVDPSGSRRYGQSLIDALQTSGAILNK